MGRTDQFQEALTNTDLDPIYLIFGILVVAIVYLANEASTRRSPTSDSTHVVAPTPRAKPSTKTTWVVRCVGCDSTNVERIDTGRHRLDPWPIIRCADCGCLYGHGQHEA